MCPPPGVEALHGVAMGVFKAEAVLYSLKSSSKYSDVFAYIMHTPFYIRIVEEVVERGMK